MTPSQEALLIELARIVIQSDGVSQEDRWAVRQALEQTGQWEAARRYAEAYNRKHQ